jgi:hypothetical protein
VRLADDSSDPGDRDRDGDRTMARAIGAIGTTTGRSGLTAEPASGEVKVVAAQGGHTSTQVFITGGRSRSCGAGLNSFFGLRSSDHRHE